MKNNTMRLLACSIILLIMASCNEKNKKTAEINIDKEQIKKDIQQREDEFAEIYNKGEVRNISYYADDSKSFYQNTPPLIGREAIVEFLKTSSTSTSSIITFKTNEVFVASDGKQVLEIGSFTLTDSSGTNIDSGNYMSLFVKRNGKYVCLRDMSTSDHHTGN